MVSSIKSDPEGGGTPEPASGSNPEFRDLCRDLNMDSATMDRAWKSYTHISANYSLEGNQLHWLACALYVACHHGGEDKATKASGSRGSSSSKAVVAIEGNGVSSERRLWSCCMVSMTYLSEIYCNLQTLHNTINEIPANNT